MDGTSFSICLVASGLESATHLEDRATQLTRNGHRVHLLLPDTLKNRSNQFADHACWYPGDFGCTPDSGLRIHGVNPQLLWSERVRQALVAIHDRQPLDYVEFVERGGSGFRTIQAKRAGLCLSDVNLAVRLVGPSYFCRTGLWDKEDLRTDHAEQFSFELADQQLATTPVVIDQARKIGWRVKVDLKPLASLGEIEPFKPREVMTSPNPDPIVSIVVTFYNLGEFLADCLGSIHRQDYPHLEVIVVDDGSTLPESRQVFLEQQAKYPSWRFIQTPNQGSGAARNQGLALATGDHVIFFDADNYALPHMVRSLLVGLERNPAVAAMTCYVLGVNKPGQIDPEPIFLNAFAGGPYLLACHENVYGDTTAIFRTEVLRGVGGYDTDRQTPWEDWMTYLRLIQSGQQIAVCPEVLFHYRVRNDGRTGQMEQTPEDRERLLQILLERYFTSSGIPREVLPGALWQALSRFASWSEERQTLRYRLVNRIHDRMRRWPWLMHALKTSLRIPVWMFRRFSGRHRRDYSQGNRSSR